MRLDLPPLRPYQVDPVAETVAHVRAYGSCLLVSPTGSGKTVMGLHAAQELADGTDPILWLGPSIDLVDQTAARVRAAGIEPRILQAGARGAEDAPVVVATVPTLLAKIKRGEALPRASVVVHDEARCHVAPQWGQVAAHYHATPRVALDATPARADGRPLVGIAASIVRGPTIPLLVSVGALVPVTIRGPSSRVDKLAAHPAAAYAKMFAGRRAIVYCRDIAHAEDTARALVERGYRAEAVHERRKRAERRDAMARFRAADLDVLTNVMTLFQGVDVPELAGVILARAVSHPSTWLQIGGRPMRPSPGKTGALVVDLMGCFHDFGPFDRHYDYSLTGEPMRAAEELPTATQCPKCLGWGPGGSVCIACGVERPPPPPPKIRARDLVELRQRETDAQKRARLERFVGEAIAKGHKPWAAAHRYKGVYGEMPSKAEIQDAIRAAMRGSAA